MSKKFVVIARTRNTTQRLNVVVSVSDTEAEAQKLADNMRLVMHTLTNETPAQNKPITIVDVHEIDAAALDLNPQITQR